MKMQMTKARSLRDMQAAQGRAEMILSRVSLAGEALNLSND